MSQIDETTDTINRLDEQAQQINSILATIQGIAEQTNLLALNAAIEAARAGKHGQGFAVVADEVRLLAQRTANSTGEIQEIINKLVSATTEAGDIVKKHSNSAMGCVKYTNEAMEAIEPVVSAVANITEMNTGIACATKEQASMVEGISINAETIKRNSEMVGISMGTVTEAGTLLLNVSESLDNMIKELKAS